MRTKLCLALVVMCLCGVRVAADPFEPLPPGAVKPAGWLRDWCVTAKEGYIGNLDDVDEHFRIAWTTNCMRRGEFLSWGHAEKGSWSAEGGAYWFDGLVRLAWQLDDPALKAYAKKRLDTLLDRMHPNAITFIHWMDRRDPAQMKEVVSHNEAWIGWAAGILGRAVAAYYRASGDPRALQALNWAFNDERFFEYGNGKPVPSAAWETYQLGRDEKVGAALDAWCRKGPDAAHSPLWRYVFPPEEADIELRPFTQKNRDWRKQHGVLACETAISALRVSFWRTGNPVWRTNILKWSDYLRANALQPYGVPVADESWGYTGPDRGTETCTVTADIRLNIEMLTLLGQGTFGDRVERALFNAAAACTTADFKKHLYVQTPNRTVVEKRGDFTCPVSARFYLVKQWPLCCTAALTRYIPDFVQHLWMATSDSGLAATLYAPNTLTAKAGGVETVIRTVTDYPFGETIRLEVAPAQPTAFPLYVRIPAWCEKPVVKVNGEVVAATPKDGFARLARTWRKDDVVELMFPMTPVVETWRDRNKQDEGVPFVTIAAGPLLFARNIPGADENTVRPDEQIEWTLDPAAVRASAQLKRRPMPSPWRWTPEAMPVSVTVPAETGPIELVPYGSTRLRVSMFNVASQQAVSDAKMRAIYEEVKTPNKRGMVLRPAKGEMLDNPMVFRHGDAWYMMHIRFDGKGYETHLAKSSDLIAWQPLGCVLSRGAEGAWDSAQADGWPSLLDPRWDGPNTLNTFDGRYWMMYLGGELHGYETDPLSTGVAWTDDPSAVKEWTRYPGNPVLSPRDPDARAFETLTIYKHFTVEDPTRSCGGRFVNFYNANQRGVRREAIGMAVSDDMLHWRRVGDGPVIDNGDPSKPGISGDPMVRRIGDVWVMFYFGFRWRPGVSGAFDTFACSHDLKHWTKWEGEPLIRPSEPFDCIHAHKPWVIKHDGVVYHYYCAVGRGEDGKEVRGIALATSK
ncbi:MAG TPA: glycoside hydrolase family 127 protein [Kiritimatiellia bacterium]|nr:glycoside hydrolase family 127 protein [Kiritimatiellia bacterium]